MKNFVKFIEAELGALGAQHYAEWVKNYGEYCRLRGLDAWDDLSPGKYLIDLGRREVLWKVGQAKDAIDRYMWWRRKRFGEGRHILLDGMRKVMKNESKSLETIRVYERICRGFLEKTGKFEGWVEDDFIVYVKEKANKISASKLNQEMSALVYFYRVILRIDVSHCLSDLRAKRKWKKVEFLNRTEIYLLIGCQGYMEGLVMKLMYGSGLRCGEVLNLKVGHINLDTRVLQIHKKGKLKREVILARGLINDLKKYMESLKKIYETEKKYAYALNWSDYAIFTYVKDNGTLARLGHWNVRRGFLKGLELISREKSLGLDVLKHSFAIHFLEDGGDIRTLQEFLGHQRVSQTLEYEKLAKPALGKIKSPLDGMLYIKTKGGQDG